MSAETLPWRYEASARGPRSVLVLGIWWCTIALGLLFVGLAPWIAALLFVVSLPAAWEWLRASVSWIEITDTHVCWGSGRRTGTVTLSEINRFRFDTRLDLSVRASLILVSGKRVHLPYECAPRAQRLKPVLDAAGISYEQHHFALLS
ncbi:MAG: hypothetical protein MK098_12670 [Marinovum sp.]|nr:hypothetical protein [Marinovum sp.]